MGSGWTHRLHDYWLLFDGVGWATLLVAHYWTWTRHRRRGLPWVLSLLWLSTWVMVINTGVFALEEFWLGHNALLSRLNWPHLIQIGTSVTFLVMAPLVLAPLLRLPNLDPAWRLGRLVSVNPWRACAIGQMVVVTVGVFMVTGGVIGGNEIFGWWPAEAVGSDPHC